MANKILFFFGFFLYVFLYFFSVKQKMEFDYLSKKRVSRSYSEYGMIYFLTRQRECSTTFVGRLKIFDTFWSRLAQGILLLKFIELKLLNLTENCEIVLWLSSSVLILILASLHFTKYFILRSTYPTKQFCTFKVPSLPQIVWSCAENTLLWCYLRLIFFIYLVQN